jgi:hypothetical protein
MSVGWKSEPLVVLHQDPPYGKADGFFFEPEAGMWTRIEDLNEEEKIVGIEQKFNFEFF